MRLFTILRNMKGIVFRIKILYRKLKKNKRPSVDETEMQRLTRMEKSFFLGNFYTFSA
jgi:hypothetical protein